MVLVFCALDASVVLERGAVGFHVVLGRLSVESEWYVGVELTDRFGEFEARKLGHLGTGNRVGIELIEWDETEGESDPDPFSSGLFHLSIIDPEVEELAQRIDDHGGDAYSEVWGVNSEDDDYKLAYCKDPWGNYIEVFSHSNERIYSNLE